MAIFPDQHFSAAVPRRSGTQKPASFAGWRA